MGWVPGTIVQNSLLCFKYKANKIGTNAGCLNPVLFFNEEY